ncbi:MAG TPA: hypothetical protein VGK49_05880, partial [Ilumatobacteraceae bacterium]
MGTETGRVVGVRGRARRARSMSLAAMTGLLIAAGTMATPTSPAPVAQAGSVITVTTNMQKIGGPGGCSLQEAILSANHDSASFTAPGNDAVVIHSACAAGSGDDIIELADDYFPLSGVIDDADNEMGPSATPEITSPVIIEGRGALLERAWIHPMRAFVVGEGGSLDLREVHVKGFAAKGGDGRDGGGGGLGAGGAIYVHGGSLLVQWSTFEANTATGGNGSSGNQFDRAGGGGGGLGGSGGLGDEHGGGGGG